MSTLLPDAVIEQAKRASLISLSERYTQLRKISTGEWAGPCPKCGGENRFHAKEDWFFCRQCNPNGGDTIEFVRWMQPGLSFVDAVAQLTGGTLPTATQRLPERTKAPAQVTQPDWRRKTTVMLQAAQERLLEADGEPARQYLISRGLEPRTWLHYGLGYRADVSVPGTEGKVKTPAICMPWYAGGKLMAVRYRFLAPQNGNKQTAEYGSQFSGRLFGGQGLPEWVTMPIGDGNKSVQSLCTLVICEGEINAMSIWQAAGDTNVHVLSLGSESAKLNSAMIGFAKRYGTVIVWADRAEVARNLQAEIPAANSITSPNGKDANDLLRDGLLGAVLGMARLRACRNDHEREGLLWSTWDAAQTWLGVDTGTVQVIQKIADGLGKKLEPVKHGI
jgi:phage/plasmid primase-like uncharacterized protein